MLVDKDKVLLVCVAISAEKPDYMECYPMEGVLALQRVENVTLAGHPGEDWKHLPSSFDQPFHVTLRPHQIRQVNQWLQSGRITGISFVDGKPSLCWRNKVKYLTDKEIVWITTYNQSIDLQFRRKRNDSRKNRQFQAGPGNRGH